MVGPTLNFITIFNKISEFDQYHLLKDSDAFLSVDCGELVAVFLQRGRPICVHIDTVLGLGRFQANFDTNGTSRK